ncbi:methyl-accepting chemotaxis protein [Oryzomonas sagensis]|uniref:Methyl-accepting chemotaxis protein n=1 Tax=Oryzomonas sagensis TaxID=2603857 RepID=A0ABQ6TR52_9BACT|nr:methyl-accepting chemotaxis protein [Oryzomonas sagensis]KAB0671202.1 methyl-accepting chemotaxis protein [Oryzomonas sagensis]
MWLKNLSIGAKLIMSFLLVLLLTVFLGIFMIGRLNLVRTSAEDVAQKQVPGILSVARISDLFGSLRRGELLMVVSNNPEDIDKYIKRNQETAEKLRKEQAAYEKMIDTDEERKLYGEFTKALQRYLAETPKVAEMALQNKDTEAGELIRGASSKYFNQALKALDATVENQAKQTTTESRGMAAISSAARTWVMIALAVCIAIGLLEAVILARLFSAPLRSLARKADQIASGDLGVEIELNSRDEIGQLSAAFGAMVKNLRELIGKVMETAAQLSAAAAQVSATAAQMSTGTEEVAAQAATVATASEEMAATSSDIATNCHMAAGGAQQAAATTNRGFEVVKNTVDGIRQRGDGTRANAGIVESLGERSDQIGAIVATIEDIADQTNLLALNAAIEAARAGEQGRGFAVVADEVRALAERTTRATKEIGDMIKAIQGQTREAIVSMEEGVRGTERGAAEAAQLETALNEILEQVNAVTMQVSQIATAAEEQTATTSEITNNIHMITQVVHDTSRGAQESAAAAAQMARQAEHLQGLVRQFRL